MEHRYLTFWQRLAAGFVDTLVFFPLVFPEIFLDMTNVKTIILIDSVYVVLVSAYTVIGHGIYGYTIGKKIFKVQLLDLSETSKIGIARAFLRESVWIVLLIISIVNFGLQKNFTGIITMEEREEIALFDWIFLGWIVLELITLLTNKKRRAIHDYIAKSVVVRVQ